MFDLDGEKIIIIREDQSDGFTESETCSVVHEIDDDKKKKKKKSPITSNAPIICKGGCWRLHTEQLQIARLPALPHASPLLLEFLSFILSISDTLHSCLGYLAPWCSNKNRQKTKKDSLHFKDTQTYLKYHIQNHNIIEIS